MKYSRTAIGLLTAQYRSVLKKCLLINLGLFALGAVTTAPANAADAPTPNTITSWTGAQAEIDSFMDALHTWSVAESEVPDWDRQNGAITGWGMDQIFGALNGTDENPGILTTTQDAINLVNNATKGNENLYSIVTNSASGNTALHDAITVTTSGNYILSTNTAAQNLGVLDTNLKSVATAVEGKLDGTSTAYDSGASGNTYYTAATINSNFATQTTVGTKLTGTALTTYKASPDATEFYNAAAVNGNFVKQEADKGLSSNDFTDTYKDSLDTLATTYQTKLATANAGNGIAISGAQVISVNKGAGLAFDTDGKLIVDLDTVTDGTDNHLMSTDQQTKLNNISTATTTSGDGYVTGELLGTTLNGYATTATASEDANGLMSKENFSKLAGIEANAQVNTIEGVQLNGTDLTLDANKKANIVAATSANIASEVTDASDSKLVTEKAVVAGLAGKQATLESGTNIKSINGQSVLGAGNLTLDDIGAQAEITSGNKLSYELVSGLGTAATAAKSTETGITTGDAGLVTGDQVASMNYLTGITSSQVTTALGFTPFNPANIIAADGEASTTNVYSASAIDTKLTGYATTATATTSANGLMSKEDFSKLAGIEANAQVNTIEGVQLNGTDLTLDANKKANIVAATSANIASEVTDASDSKLVTEKAVVAGLAGKQATLESGTNIKSINGQSVLGAGNLTLDDIGAQAEITSGNKLSYELVSGLGTSATVDLAANYISPATPTDAAIETWAGTNAAKIANVGQTFAVLKDKMTIFQNDLFATGSTANSIAAHLGATGDTTLTEAVQNLADGQISTATYNGTIADNTSDTKLATAAKVAAYGATKQDKLTQDANGGANITIDADGKISAQDTTYTQGDGITIDSTAGNKISVNAKTDGGITVNGDGVSVDTSVVQAKLTAANAGDGIAFNSTGDVFSIDLAANSGLVIDDSGTDAGKLKVDRATVVQTGNAGIVDSDLLASQNYLKNSATSKLALDTANVADLSVWNGSNILAGINISSGADTNAIQMIVNGSSNDKKAAIELDKDGAFYSKSGTLNKTTDEIATLGTAANGAYTNTAMTGVSTISGALDALQSSKQGNLTAGDGIALATDTNTISVNLTDKGGLQLDAATTGSKTLSVSTDNATIVKDDTSGNLKVGTIAQSQVSGLDTALAAKTTIAASGTDNVYTIADSKATAESQDFYNVTGTDAAIAASAATKANLAGGNQFTGDQAFGINGESGFTTKALIQGDGTAGFGMNDANNSYAFVVQKNAITANQSIAAKAGITFGNTTTYNIGADGSANLGATTVSSLNATGNVQAGGLTFDGSDIATSITKATSGETAGALSLATAGYAQEQAKAAADAAIAVDTTDETLINFYNSSSTTTPEAQTYTKAALDTQIGAKYNYNAIVGTDATETAAAEVISANTAVYSQAKSNELLGLKMNTADWTLATDATKLDGAKLGDSTVGFAAINPDDVVTSTEVATATLLDDTHLVTAGAVVAGINNAITSKEAYFTKEFGYNVHDTDAPTVLGDAGFTPDAAGNLGFSQAIIQNKTAIGNIVSAATQLDGIKMLDNSATPVAKTVHKIDNSVINNANNLPTGDEDVLATKATVLAALDNPEQDITANKVTANEVDTKALKVAATKTGAAEPTEILTAGLDADENVLVTVNGTLSTGSLKTVSANITNLRMFEADENGRKSNLISAQGIKKNVSADGNDNYLITSGGVDAEFTKKVGTLTENTGTADVPVYTTRSVADMIGVDANGALVFTEDTGVSNIASGDGTKSAPTTLVGAIENISSAMGKIHGLATNNGTATEPNITVNNNDSIFKAGNIVSSVTGETITSNLPTGTSVEEMEVYLDNAIGNIESGATLVGKAFADKDGNQIDTTYAKDADVVHLANPETITGVKTFQNGLKVGADWQMDENSQGRLVVRSASTTGAPAVVTLSKRIDQGLGLSYIDDANAGHEFLSANGNRFVLKDANGIGTFTVNNATGAVSTKYMSADATNFVLKDADGHGTVLVDNATGNLSTDGSITAGGDITTTGDVKAASLTLPNLDQTTAGATITATAIDNSATAFPATGADTTLATLASVNTLAEKATFTPATGGTLTKTTIGEAINELDSLKFAKADIVTAWSATTSDTKVASEKLVRDTLDDILDGTTPFTGFTMAKNTATSATDTLTMLAIDDGNYSDESAKTFATNLSVKSAVNKLVFGGNPNTWTGVNIFEKQIQAQQGIQIGADYKLVETDSGKLTVQIGNSRKSAMVVDKAGEFGLYKVDETAKTATPYLKATSGELRAYAANSTDGSNYQYMKSLKDYFYLYSENATTDPTFSVENATGNVNTKGNAVIAGNLTAGDATKAQLTVDNATNTISMITKDSTKAAGFAADGNSAEMQASNGTYDFTFSADVETAGKEAIAMAVSQDDGSGNDIILSAVQADKDSISMGLGDGDATSNKMAAGFSVETDTSGSSPVTTVSMGLNDANENVVTGVKVEDGKVSILADNASGSANPVIEAGYSTTNGNYVTINGNETVTGDLTATGNFSAADGDFTVTKDATSGKTTMTLAGDEVVNGKATFNGTGTTKVEIENGVVKASNGFAVPSSSDPTKNVFSVDANGGVKAQSLNLPNANKDPAAKKTVTVDSIDTGSNPTLFEKNALATTEAIRLKAQNSAFSGKGQKSLKDPYGTGAAPTTLKDAINNLATNVDDAFGSIGQYSQLDAQSQIAGSNIHKDNPAVSPDTKSPTLVSAAVDLDNAIGNRALYNNSHYANTTDTKVSVSQAIANMDGAVYQDIHGQGDATTPLKGTVNIGDKAVTTKVGAQDAAGILTGMTVDASTAGSESITFTVTDASAATPAPKDVMTINKDGVNVDGNENVTGKVTVAASSTATSKVEIDSADGSVTSTSTAGTVKLVDGTATASNTVTAGAVDATSGALSGNGVQMKNDGTVTARNGAETAHYDAAGITLNSGTADTFTVDTTNGDMMAAAGNFAVTTASGKTTMTIGAPAATATTGKVTIDTTGKIESIGSAADKKVTIDDGNVVVSGNTKTATFEMPDADQPTGATSVVYAQVTGIDVGGATTNTTFSNQALATTESIKTKAENADYTASAALKAGNYATAQTSVATINNAIESLDLRIGDWDGLHLTPNGNLTNGHAGDAGYNEPETVVEAFNNIDSTLGRIHGLVTENTDGTYTYNMTSGTETRDWTNLAVGTTVEEHVLAVNDAIGNRKGYTAAYNINRGESVAESLNNIDLRLGDVKSLNNMHYYGEQNPNDVNLTGAVRALDNNLYRVEHDLKTLRHETHAGLASAAALSALVPNPRGTGDTTLSFGTGAYQGHMAAALGGFHWITNNLLVNAGVGWDNREATTRIGVSYSF